MFRDLLSSRLIQVGLAFFVVVVSGSLLYSWQTRRTTVAEFTRTDVVPHETRSEQDTVDTSTVDFEQSETSFEVNDSQMADDAEVSPIDEASEVLDRADTFLPDDFVSEETSAEDVPVSPYGFGPYPEVPADYPEHLTPIWSRDPNAAEPFELIDRVLIKLWNQGHRDITGGSTGNGKVYPHYANTAYVRYGSEITLPDGTVHREILRIKGGPDIAPFAKQIRRGNTPAHIKIINFDRAGIDPHTFLE